MARHRPAKEGGYQRGEETRGRIIEAAVGLFAERGFEGASTRDIATAAGVNAPALQYYFDNKEGVYVACVDYILTHIWAQLSEVITHAERLLQDAHASDAALIDAYLDILGGFATLIHDNPQTSDWRLFMAREQAGLGPPAAFEMMDQGFHLRLGKVTRSIVGRLIGRDADDEATIIRTLAFNSQGMVFRVMRRPVLRALGWDSIDRERMEIVRTILLSQNRLTLEALVRERLAEKAD